MPLLSASSFDTLAGNLSAGAGRKTPNAFGVGMAIGGVAELERKLKDLGESATDRRLSRNALKKGLERVVEPVQKQYLANFPGTNPGHPMTVWHYRRYPPRGSGARTVRVGIDNRGVYIGAGGGGKAGQNRRDMRGKERGGGRHPLKAYPNQPRKDWKWFPIKKKPFITPTVKREKQTVAVEYRNMLTRRARQLGLNTR